MPFELIRNDITRMDTDAIVNAANSRLLPGGGVCGAIFAAAGYEPLNQACRKLGHCDVGQAVITPGFQLPAKYIVHAVGPIWRGGNHNEAALLQSCYHSALHLARRHGCRSIAFPLISSGIYGYPKQEALQVAIQAIRTFLLEHEMQVYLVIFDTQAVILGEGLYTDLRRYIDDHYVALHTGSRSASNEYTAFTTQLEEQFQADCSPLMNAPASPLPSKASAFPRRRSLQDLLNHLEESFSRMLLRLIDEKGMTDVEVYKRANLDRKLFSKLRKSGYNPSKQTALALAIALRLNLDETKDLLGKAGYSLSRSSKFDVIIEYFIQEQIYDIYEINEALFAFDQKLLGG